MMFKNLKKKWGPWVPFGNYRWAGSRDYIVFARKNLRNGMIKFKTKPVISGLFKEKEGFVPKDLIDVEEAWDTLVEETWLKEYKPKTKKK